MMGIAVIAGCGGGSTGSSAPGSASTSPPRSVPGSPATPPGTQLPAPHTEVTDAMGDALCDSFRPQLSDMRVQGPTLGKVALNIGVHDWALRNGGPNLSMQILGDKAMIDQIMQKRCADVRDQLLQALEIPNLAAGIAF
jgi:hypothetical protein